LDSSATASPRHAQIDRWKAKLPDDIAGEIGNNYQQQNAQFCLEDEVDGSVLGMKQEYRDMHDGLFPLLTGYQSFKMSFCCMKHETTF
jgi:hypothetical protein